MEKQRTTFGTNASEDGCYRNSSQRVNITAQFVSKHCLIFLFISSLANSLAKYRTRLVRIRIVMVRGLVYLE
ncbi:hypothetical protein ACF0H5_024409 [Mactra antiquata]